MEVFVVDNASTDGSQANATRMFPGITLIQNADNRGFASASNQGLRSAQGEMVLILNPDVVLAPTAVGLLARFVTDHPRTSD